MMAAAMGGSTTLVKSACVILILFLVASAPTANAAVPINATVTARLLTATQDGNLTTYTSGNCTCEINLLAGERERNMNKKGYGGAEAEYIRRYHKHEPADHQYSSLLITHIRPPIHPINAVEFTYPFWFSPAAMLLIDKILDPNPKTRIKIEGIKNNPWCRVNYIPVRQGVEEVNLDDVHAVFVTDHPTSPLTELFTTNCPILLCWPLTKQPEQTLAELPSRELLWWKPVTISNASGMVDREEVKVDTGQVRYHHLLPIPVCKKSTSTLSQCPLSEWPPPFSSRNCKEGDSVLLATTNSATPILRTMGVCANRKRGLCVFTVKPALLPCWFSLPKLASGVDNVQFGYGRKDELTVVVTSSRNGEKEARARREGLEH
ncbi:hypothetical protein Nepgr_028764 [Nepenthes gracilis]|uniref:Uncharacterized protein n=1 Tax=Nepenthes gracilis TaxID=150966 RepID=A0AAD3TD46_NEPGR|nr:hypothetical protein Nepgr_028764 [Nepenthes gracilis]